MQSEFRAPADLAVTVGGLSPATVASGVVRVNRAVAVVFAVIGAATWYWPRFNGFLFQASDIRLGESRIVASIFLVGAAVLWFMRQPPNKPWRRVSRIGRPQSHSMLTHDCVLVRTRFDRFEADVASHYCLQLTTPFITGSHIVPQSPVVPSVRRCQANSEIDVTARMRPSIGAATKQPKLTDITVRRGPLDQAAHPLVAHVYGCFANAMGHGSDAFYRCISY